MQTLSVHLEGTICWSFACPRACPSRSFSGHDLAQCRQNGWSSRCEALLALVRGGRAVTSNSFSEEVHWTPGTTGMAYFCAPAFALHFVLNSLSLYILKGRFAGHLLHKTISEIRESEYSNTVLCIYRVCLAEPDPLSYM